LPGLVDMGFVLSIPALNFLNGEFVDPLFGCVDCCLVVSLLEALDTVCAVPHIAQRMKSSG